MASRFRNQSSFIRDQRLAALTFNLGRDITLITLITLYPFLFGYIMQCVWAQFHGEK